VLGLLSAGCQPAKSPAEGVPAAAPASAAMAPPLPPPATTVSVDIKSWEQIQEWITAQRGKVIVVDIWSTYFRR
jgi:hypothetical protein